VNISNRTRRPISGEEEHVLLEFAHFLSGSRAPASIAAYQSDIRMFAESTPGLDLLHVTDEQEDDYIASLQRLGLKRRTITRKGTAFRYFREYLSRVAKSGVNLVTAAKSNNVVERNPVSRKPSAFAKFNEIDTALDGFMRNVQESRSSDTVRAYTSDLLKFSECLRNTLHWHQVTKQLISDFLDQQITAGLNANSTARLLSTIRSLFLWLLHNGDVLGNPTLGLSVQRGGTREPVPSATDMQIIALAAIPSEFLALRDRVIFELLYRCGLRVSEISALNISSVDLKRRRLTICGRQDRKRYINLPESVTRILAAYMPHRHGGTDALAPLVVNIRGSRLTVRSIGRVVQRLAISHNLPKGTHPFSLRHAHVAHSLKAGRDVQDIRHDLGVSGVSAIVKITG